MADSPLRKYLWLYWTQNGEGNPLSGYSARLKAQGYIAGKLRSQGYDVFDTTDILYAFPVDIAVRFENHLFGYLVSTGWAIEVSEGVRKFASFFNIGLNVVHVKQDYSWYYIEPVGERKYYCLSIEKTQPYFEQLGLVERTPEGLMFHGLEILPDFVYKPRRFSQDEKNYILSHYKSMSAYQLGKELGRDKSNVRLFLKQNITEEEYARFISSRSKRAIN